MKKVLIGSIVGGIILFVWQFLSFALINFHKPAQNYTEKQDAIMSYLNSQNLKDGGYVLPALPEGATMEEHEKAMDAAVGKPWASVQYHSKMENDMVISMIRGLAVDIVIVLLFCWLARRLAGARSRTIFTAALVTGLIVFFNAPYTNFIWYKTFDIWAHFLDALVSWGFVGLWLGWWLTRGTKEKAFVIEGERRAVTA
jgi:hypothetical protein